MTSSSLLARLQQPLNKETVAELAHELWSTSFSIKKVIDLCFHRNAQVAYHAAWILEQLCFEDIDYFLKQFSYFTEKFPDAAHPNVKRHFSKIITHILEQSDRQKPVEEWIKKRSNVVARVLFDWFVDETVKPSVKCWCIDSLTILSEDHLWIREELRPRVEALLPDPNKGLQVRMELFLKKTKGIYLGGRK